MRGHLDPSRRFVARCPALGVVRVKADMTLIKVVVPALVVACLVVPSSSDACGCFAPPTPTVPVVQAGERILFALKNGRVTAHVQVQYSGADGSDFAWLVPMPAVPTLKLGVDEVFARLEAATAPQYQLSTRGFCGSNAGGGAAFGGAGGGSASFGFADAGSGPQVVVVRDSVGPYDYAVLRADSKAPMLEWLRDNRFFVPATTDAAVDPYIRQGGYFLALKLRSGATTGDLQPVVLEYESDVAQVPITLTSVGAEQNMPVRVFMLGDGRAIPRNYHHTVLNDAVIDWASGGANLNDVIIRAAREAPGRHTFITDYAGPSNLLANAWASPSRFGQKATLATAPTASAFVQELFRRGFLSPQLGGGVPAFAAPVKAVLVRYLPPPPGVNADTFFFNYDFFVGRAPRQNYQPVEMAEQLWERFVTPLQETQALVDQHPTLTRLDTRLSPADMNRDPAFSFNKTLPNVSNVHRAEVTLGCPGATLKTEQGWVLRYRSWPGTPVVDRSGLPASFRIEVLRDEGQPELVRENRPIELNDWAAGVTIITPASVVQVPAPAREEPPMEQAAPKSGCAAVPGWSMLAVLLALAVRRRGGPRS